MIEVNRKESIKQKRIIPLSKFDVIFDKIVWSTFIVIPPIITLTYTFSLIRDRILWENIIEILVINILSLGLAYLVYFRVKTALILTRVEGLGGKNNSQFVLDACSDLNWKRATDKKDYLIVFPPRSMTSWGHQITIIFIDDDILINSITLGIGSIISPFHRGGDIRRMEKLISTIKSKE